MSYFVETLSNTGEWALCSRRIGIDTGSDLDIDPDIHSGRPTEFFAVDEAKNFLSWIWKQQMEGIQGARIVEPVIGVERWKTVCAIGRSS